MEWLGVAIAFVLFLTPAVGLLIWRDHRRGPACPWCGRPGTFAGDDADVCENCGFDFRTDDH